MESESESESVVVESFTTLGQIISKQGSEVVVRSKEGTEIRRNVSNVKPIHGSHPNISPGDQSVTHSDRPVRERRPIERYGNPISH